MEGRKIKKFVLAALNAKYIHSNPAVYSLKANAGEHASHVKICEYTINHTKEEILAALYGEEPDIIGFSCYLWNIEYILAIAEDLKKIRPGLIITAGGPEVSYRPEEFLRTYRFFDVIMVGEGEKTFSELLSYYFGDRGPESGGIKPPDSLAQIRGLVYREGEQIIRTPSREGLVMDELAFLYKDLSGMENRIIYYESMRGCPFSCSYCLSSIEKSVRCKSLGKTLPEIDFFLQAEVRQVKFVDRTFNCIHEHAYAIWKHIKEHDNGITNFHFEIAGDLLQEEDFCLFDGMRPGLMQFEIGVQSTNPDTIRAIGRTMDIECLARNIIKLRKSRNIHVHLDLIAGLPYEDYASFKNSFCDVYRMKPEQLQLGFLKVLYGSGMKEAGEKYGLIASSCPPYEVYATNWLSYREVRKLKQVEEMIEVYYNSAQFTASIAYLLRCFETPFDLYYCLGQYYKEQHLSERKHSRLSRYEILWDFAMGTVGIQEEWFRDALTYDLYSREYVKSPPGFVQQRTKQEKEEIRKYFDCVRETGELPEGYEGYTTTQLQHMLYVHKFHINIEILKETGNIAEEDYRLLFDYRCRNPLDYSAKISRIGRQYFL